MNAADGPLQAPVSAAGSRLLDLLAAHTGELAELAAADDRAAVFPTSVFESMRADGVLAATVPADYGGLGVDRLQDVALALLRLASANASAALALHMQLSRGLTLQYELCHGSQAGKEVADRLLQQMGRAEAVVCGAVAEDRSGSAGPTTLTRNGNGWLVLGHKSFVTLAPVATHFMVSALVRDQRNPPTPATAVVTRQARGVTVNDDWDGLGMRTSGSVSVRFDRCHVDASDVVLRDPGESSDRALVGRTIGSICMLGVYVGVAEAARHIAVGELRRRKTAVSDAGKTLLATVDARLYAMRATLASALDQTQELTDGEGLVERGRALMSAFQCAKLTVNELAPAVVDLCMSLIGGGAYAGSHPLSRLYRDVRAGGFMQPYAHLEALDFLGAEALRLT